MTGKRLQNPRSRLVVAVAAVVAVAVVALGVVVGLRVWGEGDTTRLERALALAPADGERFSWTDWAGVRRELGLDLTARSPSGDVDLLLDRGFDADLTSTSALVSSAVAMQRSLGFSPASIDWELFTQSTRGAVVMTGLPDDADFDAIGDSLEEAGYTRPSSADGRWDSDPVAFAQLGTLTPELTYLTLDAERGLVLGSDTIGALDTARAALDSDQDLPQGLTDVAGAVGSPRSAALYGGAQACRELAMADADPSDQETADDLLRRAGEVNPLTGYAIAAEPSGEIRVAMGFENDEQARTNADTRAVLAAGPAPGQGGDFTDRFTLGEVVAQGRVVTLQLRPVADYVLSDLSTGPVLFATC